MRVAERARAREAAKALGDIIEEPRLSFRPEEGAQELATGARVVLDADPISGNAQKVTMTGTARVEPLEERKRDVAVADSTDQPREPLDSDVERVEDLALVVR